MAGSILGTSVRRIEDPELLVGRGSYVDNLQTEGALHAAFVRTPLAHARILGVDTSEALDAPGVVAVLTADDTGHDLVPVFASANKAAGRTALAHDRVRYVGEPVALVVAETRAQAVDAIELVDVDYDELPVVVDVEQALAAGAPTQSDALESNVAAQRTLGDLDDALAGAARVVRLRMENHRLAVAPIEGHAILVQPGRDPDDGSDTLTVWVGTQQPHMAQRMLSKWTGLDAGRIRLVAPHVGGAFGGKAGVVAEHLVVVTAARTVGRPVKWVETRSEAMLSMHGRGQVQYAELGLDDEHRITGMRLRVLGDCGAYAGFGGGFATGPTLLMSQGSYDIPKLAYQGAAVLTNTSPVGAFRGAGRPEATALLERLLDFAAGEVGLAPEELRRRNFLRPDAFPFETPTGATYDVADFDLPLTEALRVADVAAARTEQQRRRESGDPRQIGIGVATYIEITGFGGTEYGGIRIHPDGSATVLAGTSAHGQGHATSFAMLASDRLGIPLERIRYVQSDTAEVRSGGGTGGSRSLQMGGNAVRQAADEMHDKALEIAARMLEVDPGDLAVDGDGFGVAGVPDSRVDWPALAAYAHEHDGGLTVDTDFEQDGATFPFGAHVSVVEVDTETGRVRPLRHVAVDDCGRVLNPLLVAGQQHGGAIQGMSHALWEEFVYDEQGIPMTSSFADYALPTAADVVQLEVSTTETPTPLNPLGAKGIGESATIGATPAVQNAVVDALRHLGVRHIDIPCTPARVHRAITRAAAGQGDDVWREPPPIPD